MIIDVKISIFSHQFIENQKQLSEEMYNGKIAMRNEIV